MTSNNDTNRREAPGLARKAADALAQLRGRLPGSHCYNLVYYDIL